MTIEQASYWMMIGLGAVSALGLAGCCLLINHLLPRPRRFGFDITDDRQPGRRPSRPPASPAG